ncbi:hypothetical protein B566_EDAN015253 [Ephemera danica]|nr:hypothetical protein B566_EDAN015253 [Ephemera danica]
MVVTNTVGDITNNEIEEWDKIVRNEKEFTVFDGNGTDQGKIVPQNVTTIVDDDDDEGDWDDEEDDDEDDEGYAIFSGEHYVN